MMPKFLDLPDGDMWSMRDVIADARQRGAVHFANGCFDLFHDGHRHYLFEAAQGAELLIVAINNDASVRRLKGPGRPVDNEQRRFTNVYHFLDMMGVTGWVVVFCEDTPESIIRAIHPDLLVKGDDTPRPISGEVFVTSRGGSVRIVERIPGISTTQLIEQQTRRN